MCAESALYDYPCPWCGEVFHRFGDQLRHQDRECMKKPADA